MATEKKGPWAKFMHWYESYKGKTVVNIVYSVGASVVIIGALFKILHWPGASQVLMIGMFTESFLFLIGTLDRPHAEFHWENVFPQLLEYGAKPELLEEKSHQARPTLLGAGVAGGELPAQSGAPVATKGSASVPQLSESEMVSLKDGITDLAKTAAQLSELGKVATATAQLETKLTAASAAADKFAQSQDALANASTGLGASYETVRAEVEKAATAAKGYEQAVSESGAKVAALNAIYELQINTIQAQADAYKAQTAQLQKLSANVEAISASAADAQKSHEAYTAATAKLAKQVADLNGIYGNMLNALA